MEDLYQSNTKITKTRQTYKLFILKTYNLHISHNSQSVLSRSTQKSIELQIITSFLTKYIIATIYKIL